MKMTPEMIEQARAMRDAGMFYHEIADAIGASKTTVQYHLKPDYRKLQAAYNVEYVADNKEEIAAYKAAYREENIAEITEYQAVYTAGHKREKAEYDKAYGEVNRERIATRSVEYRSKNKEKLAVSKAVYQKAHRPERNAYEGTRRALKAGFILGATAAQKAAIKEVYRKAREGDNIRCELCGERIPKGDRQVDHVMPLSKGGSHLSSNLEITCSHCNLKKHAKNPNELGILI